MGSLFSGIGGFELGFEGVAECRWQVEIDRSCRKLLAEKFPNVSRYEDIRQFRPDPVTDRVDIICGGSPCQDLSVAGQRQGLDGERSGLFREMVRVCKRMRPRHVVWENVDGAFSSNEGRDFACVIRAFTGFAPTVPAEGWGRAGFVRTPFPEMRWNIAWRLFDAQYFGLAQRRRRVFLVGSFGDASCLEILFEPESLCWNPPPSRETGQRIAPTVEGRAGRSGETRFATSGGLVEIPSCANRIGAHHRRDDLDNDTYIPIQSINMKRERKQNGIGIGEAGDEMFTLTARDHHAIAFSCKNHAQDAQDDLSPALRSMNHDKGNANGGGQVAVAFQTRIARNGRGQPEDICPTLNGADAGATSDMRPCVAETRGVRRLTPLECERLQGFPDGWTLGFADSVRYRMLGNAVPPPIVRWIARRIK